MADDYLSDREQEEALRNFWRENWRWIVGGVVLGLAVLGGLRYYETARERAAGEAAQLYRDLQAALAKPDVEQASTVLATLTSEHGSLGYAQQGRLLLAKAQVDAGKLDEAIAQLRAVADESKDEELAQIARLRVARLLIQQDKHDEALQLLNVDSAGAFTARVREIRGDALYAKGDRDGARAEYAAALADNADAQTDRTLLEVKLQEVGGATPPPGLQKIENETNE
jgi:predicted negative regulator of RcsB-dependent stress response